MATLDTEVANGVISRAVALQLRRVKIIYKFKSDFRLITTRYWIILIKLDVMD